MIGNVRVVHVNGEYVPNERPVAIGDSLPIVSAEIERWSGLEPIDIWFDPADGSPSREFDFTVADWK